MACHVHLKSLHVILSGGEYITRRAIFLYTRLYPGNSRKVLISRVDVQNQNGPSLFTNVDDVCPMVYYKA